MKIKFLISCLIIFLFSFFVVLAWNIPEDDSFFSKNLINTSLTSQDKQGDLFLNKIENNGYFLDLDNPEISANLKGVLKVGNLFLPCEESVEGAIRYDDNLDILQVCIESEWENLKSETIRVISIIGDHTYEECVAKNGAVVKVNEGNLCFYGGKSCPSGWTQYKNYSSTYSSTAQGCSVYYNKRRGEETCPCRPEPACRTGSHLYLNRVPETCVSPGYYRGGSSGCHKYKQPVTARATAVVYQVGCY